MCLLRPTAEMADAYLDFARDWDAHGEAIVPYSARLLGRDYPSWLADTFQIETRAPEGFVTADTYFYFDEEGRLVGALNLRHTLSDYLRQFGGHIGYGVRPTARRKGYAAAMLGEALPLARTRGLSRVLVTCDKQNTGSARTIQRNGGVLENEVVEDEEIVQRYWIDL